VTDIYLHVGLWKTGTTSIQASLETAADDLAARGVLFPGARHRSRHHAQRLAAYDLLGRRIQGDNARQVPGAWAALRAEIDAWTGSTVVVSEELLALARPRQVSRLDRALRAHRLHVVVGVRDLARMLVSGWQQEVVGGRTFPWAEYAAAVRDLDAGPASAGVAFWMRNDLLRVLRTWETAVPRDRLTVLTVPPSGGSPEVLLDRFGAVLGLPPGTLPMTPRNQSLGAVEVEVVRRLNVDLAGALNHRQYLQLVDRPLRAGLAGREGSRPLRLPASELSWVTERSDALVAAVREGGYRVAGDLDDLAPRAAPVGERALDDVTETELLDATRDALRAVSREYASLWRRHRHAMLHEAGDATLAQRAVSRARASGFRLRLAALAASDRSRVLRWLARRYLRLTSSGLPPGAR
jgi:hypothetical protein